MTKGKYAIKYNAMIGPAARGEKIQRPTKCSQCFRHSVVENVCQRCGHEETQTRSLYI